MRRWGLVFLSAVLVGGLLWACVVNRVTGSHGLVLVPDDIMNQLGAQSFQEVKQQSKISHNPRWDEVSRRAAMRIATATEAKYNWEFLLVESQEANAFALPGGKITVYTGILSPAQNEATLAFVLGHEVGHVIARHGAQRITQGMLAQGALVALDATVLRGSDSASRELVLAGLGMGAQVGVLLPFSRYHESEADHMGLIYMARAGYDPTEAPKFWERMGQGQVKPPEFLSTHPSDESRSARLREILPTAQEIYAQSRTKYGKGESLP